jgi:WXG100 family type VII secretion target
VDVNTQGQIAADNQAMINIQDAMTTCSQDCQNISNRIDGAISTLRATWTSDSAAPAFLSAVDQWQEGFQQVQAGLVKLNTEMQQYQVLTHSTEQGTTQYAGGWAQ